MKYCLLLCGMLISSLAFSQDKPEKESTNELSGNMTKAKNYALDVINKTSQIFSETVYATYYANKFEGRRTTSGVRYRGKKLTAAHLTLPFGTIVTVTNPDNGRSVDVEINDRGPHSKKFKIDVSAAAAKALGFYGKGVAQLEISYLTEEE
ncbi:MAG TPA: septal ring lytic transglycosylase RlpA family protein [Pedobacter sp.]|uniref:septal ring lytic transglycosylase RlpA family protein n=1 Tax=Pedobacter sp. TaxID=1411316 RepID=UPI002C37F458|nr:septal ring lytic transglycosylase RlpA family protein [Pedobacter sp.]HMI01510.1 septal ring lytic transglycosylase RlpA family protein [Pedobacter sp.]